MKHSIRFFLAFAVLMVVMPAAAYGHFKLIEPISWLIEGERGDPQKAGPCGVTNNDNVKRSNVITKATGGQKLHLKVQEMVYHPGHYRVALAVNSPAELPPDPEVTTRDTEKGPWSVSTVIQNPMACSCMPLGRPARWSPLKQTCSSRISTAKSALCKSWSSWPIMAIITLVDIHITTARSWRLQLTLRNRSTRGGRSTVDLYGVLYHGIGFTVDSTYT
jgi:hypothetical protein